MCSIPTLKCPEKTRLLLYMLLSCVLTLYPIIQTMFKIFDFIQDNRVFHLVTFHYNFQESQRLRKYANGEMQRELNFKTLPHP